MDTLFLPLIILLAFGIRINIRPYRRWDVVALIFGTVLAVLAITSVLDANGASDKLVESLKVGILAGLLPFSLLMLIVLIARLSLAAVEFLDQRVAGDGNRQQQDVTRRETYVSGALARAHYSRWIGPA